MNCNIGQKANLTASQIKLSARHLWTLALATMFAMSIVASSQAKTIETVVPKDSFFYLKLQNLQSCREEIGNSKNWEQTANIISALPKWQSMNQFMEMLPTFVGTDIHGLIQAFLGHGLAMTVSPGAEGLMVGIVIENDSKHPQKAEEIFDRFLQTVSGIEGNLTELRESVYSDITFKTIRINEQQLAYGRLNETLLLVGVTTGSFEKMVDVYKNEKDSIVTNSTYRTVSDKFGKSDISMFVDMQTAMPYVKALLPSSITVELESFRTLAYSWELLYKGGSQWVYGQLKEELPETSILLRQEGGIMQTLRGLSGQESFFLTLSSSIASKILQNAFESQTDTSMSEGIPKFLIPEKMDVLKAVTGEVAISVDDLFSFGTITEDLYDLHVIDSNGVIQEVKIDFPVVDLGVIFKPDFPMEWQTLFNGILERMTDKSPQQFNYNGTVFNRVDLPGELYYANVNGLFVLAFSEKHVKSILNNILTRSGESFFEKRLTQLPATPAFLLQVNLDDYLAVIITEEEAAMFPKKIGILQSSITLQKGEAWLEMTISPDEMPIDALALLTPFLFLEVVDLPFLQ